MIKKKVLENKAKLVLVIALLLVALFLVTNVTGCIYCSNKKNTAKEDDLLNYILKKVEQKMENFSPLENKTNNYTHLRLRKIEIKNKETENLLKNIEQKLDTYTQTREHLEENITNTKAINNILEERITLLESELNSSNKLIEKLKQNTTQLETENKLLRQKLNKTEKELKTCNIIKEELNKNITTISSQNQKLIKKTDIIKTQLANCTEKNIHTETELRLCNASLTGIKKFVSSS